MDPKSALLDPNVCPSIAWAAVKELLGKGSEAWEPDTFRLELSRRGIEPKDGLMAKVLGAQTIDQGRAWTKDHDPLFAFALACDGVPAAADAISHPTPEQLCWAIREVAAITGAAPSRDEGFDPDAVDPAIAVVLHDEGWFVAPDELSFCQDALTMLNLGTYPVQEVLDRWKTLRTLPEEELRRRVRDLDEGMANAQLQRLADARLYVAEHESLRARQHASLAS